MRIVVADDDAVIRGLVTHVLGKQGYEVIPASSGEEVLTCVSARRPDAIVLDAMMPDLDGFEVLHQLRKNENTRDIPVMILSARVLESDMISGFDFGANDYLVKPFRPEELVTRLRRLVSPARQWDRDAG